MAMHTEVETLLAQVQNAPGFQQLRALRGDIEDDSDTLGAMISEALRFSRERLSPFDTGADRSGCRLEHGRVILAPDHKTRWDEFRDAGWTALDIDAEYGGAGLPRIFAVAVQECFDRGSVCFGMVPGAARAAARLLKAHANPATAQTWIQKFASGEWGATICISEAGAGSDVGRIRTSARRDEAGRWTLFGEKMWISYADHDLTERIGHIVLARPEGAVAGARGLSVFLVPSVSEAPDGTLIRNGLVVRRIEEKLGLHGSPTCVLGLEDAQAELIGIEGRGVAQLFSMIVAMRLQVGTQGLGLAEASFEASARYARERRQGGPWNAPPVPIAAHADVQLTLMRMASRIATLRGIVYAGAIAGDLADAQSDSENKIRASLLQAWLLPIIKNTGAETAFDAAADAILLFGGAGYTKEWPVERYLRDSRILGIYEGTAGMQALDLVGRRWRVPHSGYETFVECVTADIASAPGASSKPLQSALGSLQEACQWLRDPARQEWQIAAASRAMLTLATETAHGWIGTRLAAMPVTNAATERLAACGRFAVSIMIEKIAAARVALSETSNRKKNCEEFGFDTAD